MIRLIIIFVFSFLLASCAEMTDNSAGWSYDGPVNSCDEDQDCSQGTCHPQLGLCSIVPPGCDLIIKVIPDPSTGAPPQTFDVTLNASGNIDVPLEIGVPVTVNAMTIARTDEDHTSALEARVIFTDTGNQLPGRSARITVYEAHNSMNFDLEMLPGKYRVMVIPESLQAMDFPVLYIDELVVDSSGLLYDSNDDPMDLVVPVGSASVVGVVLQGGLPMNGLDVVAVDPTNGRIISTADTTECKVDDDSFEVCGKFDIMIASGIEDFSLRISRPFEPHHPEFVIGGFSMASAVDNILDLTGDPALSLDPLGVPVQYHAKVNKPVKTPDGMFFQDPAPGCFVLFESNDVGGGRIEKWVTTNENGALEEIEGVTGINLYPGDYKVTIIPAMITASTATDYTAYTTDEPIAISEASQEEEQIFTLSWRPLLEGIVVANGENVPVSTLTAEAVGDVPQTVRPGTSSTGFDGSFSMWLDSADYHVAAEAPVESGFAWGTEVIEISGNGTTSIELPIPFVVNGTITPSSDQANPIDVGGSIIEWYRVVEGQAYAVGRSTADSLGHFTTLLAP